MNLVDDITFVLTSCCRNDLLHKTIESFLCNNTTDLKHFLMIEDGTDKKKQQEIIARWGKRFQIIIEGHRGHLPSVDRVYQEVKTKYVFHCQDDWDFYRKGNFVQESYNILEEFPNIGLVWIRRDDNPHPLQPEVHSTRSGVKFQKVVPGWEYGRDGEYVETGWFGFSFNPGLRRLSDYQKMAPLAPYKAERHVNHAFRDLGLETAVLMQDYVRHIGWERSLKP